jgi:hypothetical protein
MKFASATAVAALAATLSSPATAVLPSQTFNLGNVTGQPIVSQNVVHPASETFLDIFNFSISGPNNSSSYLLNVAVPSLLNVNFTFLGVYESGGVGSWNLIASDSIAGDGFSLNLGPLAVNSYQARVQGTATGSLGGSYVYAMAAPVPEPHEWAMMLAGLGMVGVIASRRRRAAQPA